MDKSVLIVGVGGSMGSRRVRCLQYLGYKNIYGLDSNQIRCEKIEKTYSIICYADVNECFNNKYDFMIISVPPHVHHIFIEMAISRNIKYFVEASVLNSGYPDFIKRSFKQDLINFPSCTLYFHPAIKLIDSIVKSNRLGKISNITYHSGQNLNDWHPYEDIRDFYVSRREVGGCREIVPFELAWITKIFGFPNKVFAEVKKTVELKPGVDIDDVYSITMDYVDFTFNVVVDVVSRPPIRELLVSADNGQIRWNWNDKFITLSEGKTTEQVEFTMMAAAEGYNKNITEEMYIDEIKHFVSLQEKEEGVNSLYYDNAVLNLLYKAEDSSKLERKLKIRNTGILLNIRLGSKRLHHKHLRTINGKMAIEWLVLRLKQIVKDIPDVAIILASGNKHSNRELIDIAKTLDIEVYFGDDNNIPKRHLECANYYGFTHLIPIDADDIFVSELAINSLFDVIKSSSNKIMKTVGLPFGTNLIFYETNYLRSVLIEHTGKIVETGWHRIFVDIPELFIPCVNSELLRFTLDYEDDLKFFEKIITKLGDQFLSINTHDLVNVVIDNQIYECNSYLLTMYWNNFNEEKKKEISSES